MEVSEVSSFCPFGCEGSHRDVSSSATFIKNTMFFIKVDLFDLIAHLSTLETN